jgi:hypothetical protein
MNKKAIERQSLNFFSRPFESVFKYRLQCRHSGVCFPQEGTDTKVGFFLEFVAYWTFDNWTTVWPSSIRNRHIRRGSGIRWNGDWESQ